MNKLLFPLSFYLFVSLLTVTPLFSQQLFLENGAPSHPEVLGFASSTRTVIDLNGTWEYSLDNGISWRTVKIPAAADYEGKIVYRRKFKATDRLISDNRFTFVSYGINHRVEIYINETFVGRHEGGHTSFSLTIPENLIQIGDENVIRLAVNNTLDFRSTFPPRQQVRGWKNYNGLLRDLFIVAEPTVRIDKANVVVEAIEPKAVKLLVSVQLTAEESRLAMLSGKNFELSAEVLENSSGLSVGKPVIVPVTLASGSETSAQISVAVPSAKLWSPDTPDLYSVNIRLSVVEGKKDSLIDERSLITGIRTLTKDKTRLLLNGAPVSLRGVVWIEDSERYGSALTYEAMEKDVALIKNLGANAVRIGFHPPHPFFLQLCDRYGLLAMVEIPNFEIPAKILEQENYRTAMTDYLTSVIERDKYNPSVIAWGLGEGFGASTDAERNIATALQRTAKSLDDRPTYVVSRGGNDPALMAADIAAISFPNVDVRTLRTRLTAFKELHAKKPVIVAGYGRSAEDQNKNGYSDPHSQEAQARNIQQKFSAIKEADIAGSMVAAFNDFRSDRPILSVPPVLPEVQTIGLVAMDRQKKVSYDIVHSLYHQQKVSALPIGTFVPETPYLYVAIGLALLIVAAWLVNGNRRFRESTRRAIFNSYNFFADIRDQFTLPLFHTTITAAIIAVTVAVIFSSILHHYRTDVVLDYLLSHFLSDDLKNIVIAMAWNPLVSIIYISGALIGWFILLTLFIQLFAMAVRVKIRWFHSYSIAVWTALPWAFFIPVGMILYRVMESEPYVPWVMTLVVLMSVWVYVRTLKGISVIYHIYTPKMYMAGIVFLFVLFGGLYAYFDYANALTSYAEFFVSRIFPFVH